jgi:UDP-N-acetylglucosamine--N-acetylmuramyl-(pentapeptide) pyrophosphoryl-undecaprenol N-acetylglucosamine transferase
MKYHRAQFWLNLLELSKLPMSLYQMVRIFQRHKPDIILSFGGYIAFPVALVGKCFGAKIITHEQTKSAGLANTVIAWMADTIAVADSASLPYFPKTKTVVTGNPLRASLLKEYKTPPAAVRSVWGKRPCLYITGGSQGSLILNQTVSQLLPKLTEKFLVVHQCGPSTNHGYMQDLERRRSDLPAELQPFYIVQEWFDAKDVSFLLRQSYCVISRGGANTVEELTLSGTPAIFIPLVFAYHDEQAKNVQPLTDAGAAIVLPQKDLLPETLWATIQKVGRRYVTLKRNAEKIRGSTTTNGTQNLIRLIRKLSEPVSRVQ